MSSTTIAAWVGVAGFFASVYNLLWNRLKEWRTQKSIRAMIRIEIEDNIARVLEFQSKANQASTLNRSPLSSVQKCDALRLSALPTFNHSVWRSLTASIPSALSPEKIARAYRFHSQLDELVVLKERHDLAPSEHADAVEKTLKRIIENGNPLL